MERTIAAIASGCRAGGIGVLRISGRDAFAVAGKVFFPRNPAKTLAAMPGYTAALGDARTAAGEKLDECVALVFRAPHSYTGEDVVELSCHGGLFIMERLLEALYAAGAAPAGPGEFTRRAFLHGKMDLTQAEAVMATIGAQGELALRAANAARDGALYRRITGIRTGLVALAAHAAAWSDFPEEDVEALSPQALEAALEEAAAALRALLDTSKAGMALRDGVDTVLCGRPNAGKSTLMNLLAGYERSIVTDIAGTTRDVVEETVTVGGVVLRLADTAGLRDARGAVEKIGVAYARRRVEAAALVLAVFDGGQPLEEEDFALVRALRGKAAIAVVNKTDLPQRIDAAYIQENFQHVVFASARQGGEIPGLAAAVRELTGVGQADPDAGLLSGLRQRDAARRALEAVEEALGAARAGVTLDAVAVCVQDAILQLDEITGERATDSILDTVFSTFCVGK